MFRYDEFKTIDHTNSNPMTPAPIKTIFFGTCLSESAPVDETIVSSSIYSDGSKDESNIVQVNLRTVMPGNGVTSEPTAKRIFFALSVSLEPSSFWTVT